MKPTTSVHNNDDDKQHTVLKEKENRKTNGHVLKLSEQKNFVCLLISMTIRM